MRGKMAVGYMYVAITLLVCTVLVSSQNETNYRKNCEFVLADMKVRDDVNEALEAGSKLIKFHFKFKEYPDDVLDLKGTKVFRPAVWYRSTNIQGKNLLKLDDNFEVLSLSLLGMGVTEIVAELDDRPYGCLLDVSHEDRLNKIRLLLLNDFKMPGPDEMCGLVSKHESVCNMRIASTNGYTVFVHHCCHISPDAEVMCDDIERGGWMGALLTCITLIKVLVILYSPVFIPERFYRKKYSHVKYVHRFPQVQGKKKITVLKTEKPANYTGYNSKIVPLENLEGFDSFKTRLNSMDMDKKYELSIDQINLAVKSKKLLPENYVPVSLLNLIRENVFWQETKHIPGEDPYCTTVMCRDITLLSCLKVLARLLFIALLALPWIVRMIIYYRYEAPNVEDKKNAAKNLDLEVNFRGSFTVYQTPLHGLFFFIYIIAVMDWCAYGLLTRSMKNRLIAIPKKCLSDTRNRSLFDVYSWAVSVLLLPLSRFKRFGCILIPLFWILLIPCILPFLIFYTFPAVNFTFRLIIHFFIFVCPNAIRNSACYAKLTQKMSVVKDYLKLNDLHEDFKGKENLSIKEILIHVVMIILSLISFWSLTFLLMECLSFFVEMGVYTLMGLIFNAGATLEYIAIIFIICVYAYNYFGSANKNYLEFHKTIQQFLTQKTKDEITKVNTDINMAFEVKGADDNVGAMPVAEVKEGRIMWKTKRLLLFLNERDQPFTPSKFFFQTINMNYYACPGNPWKRAMEALYKFIKVLVFLLFVLIVISIFANKFSTINEAVAMTAAGLLPLIFMTFFKINSPPVAVDQNSVVFLKELNKAIEKYEQVWPVADIVADLEPSAANRGEDEKRDERREENREIGDNRDLDEETMGEGMEENSDMGDNRNNDEERSLMDFNTIDIDMDLDSVDFIIDYSWFHELHHRLGVNV